jgi:glycosyltransferase involved in cell wall biosynthesis
LAVEAIRRILFSESSPKLGGQELQLLQQMDVLARREIQVKLACRPGSEIHGAALERGHDVALVPFRNALHLPSIRIVRRLLTDWQPDVVVSHSGHDANICGLAARLTPRRPRLIRARTYQHGVPHAWTYNWLTDLTLVPSQEVRSKILQNSRIDPKRIQILYPGLDFDQIARQAAQPLPGSIDSWLSTHPGRLIVHAAMLRPEKGHLFMLDVLTGLLPDFPDLRYVVAGDGEQRETIAMRVQALGLREQVLLTGMLQPVAPLLKRAALVIMPSFFEPLGMAQIEALSMRIPVVASNVDGIPETVTDLETGLLAKPGDFQAWSAALRWALDHPQSMDAMAATGRSQVLAKFSIVTNIECFLDYARADLR